MLANIRSGNIITNVTTNNSKNFECHPRGEDHGHLLLGIASAGIAVNLSVVGLIMARKALRRWSSGLLIHGAVVDGSRSALLLPIAISVLRCQPITRCSIIDTAFLLLATVSSLNLLTASLSDAPLLPPPLLVPSLLRSAGFSSSSRNPSNELQHANRFNSPLYPKGGQSSYYSSYYEEDANLLDETTAMPDSPQCVLFASFVVWFAALTINLGPTFLSGALAAQAEIAPRETGCPLVRGPARHIVLNILWAAVNLLCVFLAASQLRKLKKDLTRARIGLLAAAGAGLAGLAGLSDDYNSSGTNHVGSKAHSSLQLPSTSSKGNKNKIEISHNGNSSVSPSEINQFLRKAQKNGENHIRTLGTLAIVNLICWVPLYICALFAPIGTGVWKDPAPLAYEITLITAFTHSIIHPIVLLFLHEPLRDGLRKCIWDSCCCICQCFGMELADSHSLPPSPIHARDYDKRGVVTHVPLGRSGSQPHLHVVSTENLSQNRRTPSLKSNKSYNSGICRTTSATSCHLLPNDENLPPPPLPPINSAFRRQVSIELQQDRSSPTLENRW